MLDHGHDDQANDVDDGVHGVPSEIASGNSDDGRKVSPAAKKIGTRPAGADFYSVHGPKPARREGLLAPRTVHDSRALYVSI